MKWNQPNQGSKMKYLIILSILTLSFVSNAQENRWFGQECVDQMKTRMPKNPVSGLPGTDTYTHNLCTISQSLTAGATTFSFKLTVKNEADEMIENETLQLAATSENVNQFMCREYGSIFTFLIYNSGSRNSGLYKIQIDSGKLFTFTDAGKSIDDEIQSICAPGKVRNIGN